MVYFPRSWPESWYCSCCWQERILEKALPFWSDLIALSSLSFWSVYIHNKKSWKIFHKRCWKMFTQLLFITNKFAWCERKAVSTLPLMNRWTCCSVCEHMAASMNTWLCQWTHSSVKEHKASQSISGSAGGAVLSLVKLMDDRNLKLMKTASYCVWHNPKDSK